MARVPREEIERIKREIGLQGLVEAAGVELARHGAKDLAGRCPFHNDRTPSLIVTPSTNEWHCMGACNEGGDVIQWVMKTRGVSFTHAVRLLQAEAPALAAPVARVVKRGTAETVKLETPVSAEAGGQEALKQVAAFYHETLKGSPEALAYLKSRGLGDPDMIERCKLGFANRTLGYRLPDKNRKQGAELRGCLQRLGILRESGHEHFNGSIVIPIFDLSGNVTGMYGRKITPSLREGTPLHLYLPGPHRGVWNEEALAASKEIILCESLIDALTFWTAGFRNVTASYGVNGFTDDHREAFRKHGIRAVWIAYDRDEAGDAGAERLQGELAAMGIGAHRVLFPKGMDANEYAQKVTPAEQSLAILLNRAEWRGARRPAPQLTSSAAAEGSAAKEGTAGAAPAIPGARDEGSPPAADSQSLRSDRESPVIPPVIPPVKPPVESPVDPPLRPSLDPSVGPSLTPSVELSLAPPQPVIPLAALPEIEIHGEEITMRREDRRYRVRGLDKNTSYEVLKVNVLAARGEAFHADTFDLQLDRQRAAFIKRTAEELGVKEDLIRRDVGGLFLALEQRQSELIRRALEPASPESRMTSEEREAALALLKDPHLIGRILEAFDQAGLVGEETGKLLAYIAAVSRHLESPLAVVVQSSSASGKSALMEAALQMVPEEERIQYSAMTGQSLFYMGQTDLKHKVLAIAEEEGASRASYALKLLQSEGTLSIASTGKDPATGKLVTQEYRVEGPVMLFLTTTAIDIDEELLNRCLVLSVNEDRAQTQAIHRLQRERQTLEGLIRREERRRILALHRNAQRLLKPLTVVNPYARDLTFPDALTRSRRDHMKYLTLIQAIALLHQHQRPVRTAQHAGKTIAYIEASLEDVELANRLAGEVLGRSLDELQPQTRRLLELIHETVELKTQQLKIDRSDFRFSRKRVRDWTAWTDSTLKRHLARLEDMEYLVAHRGGRGQSFVYELVFEPAENPSKPWLPGLISVYDLKKSGANSGKSAPSPPQVRGVSGGGSSAETRASIGPNGVFGQNCEKRIYRGIGDAALPS